MFEFFAFNTKMPDMEDMTTSKDFTVAKIMKWCLNKSQSEDPLSSTDQASSVE